MIELETDVTGTPAGSTPWALEDLPPFPPVAARLMKMLAGEDADLIAAGRLISAEPVFATRVLQMANSPLFGLRQPVKTISHALIVLGLARVRAITVTRALGDFLGSAMQATALRACWRHSLAGALLAEKLGRACQIDPDLAYTAGMLRDIGRLALLVKFPEAYTNVLAVTREHGYDLMVIEQALFEIDHCQAGLWIIERLPFPSELREVVAHHHRAWDGGPLQLVQLVGVADALADALGFAVVHRDVTPEVADVLRPLPNKARMRFDQNMDDLKAEIQGKLDSWN